MSMEVKAINAVRMLGVDAINRANSGHPGMVLGAAPLAYVLFSKFINATPKESKWINRDRFVLAAGHASMLLYANLHLCGYQVSLDDLKNFRQVGSNTPGHPEYGHTDGVDCTAGPLGQGIAHAVGMALAEKILASKLNHDDLSIINHYTYALCGDGDLHEGVTQEAISFAGHQKLEKLIILYDRNRITLDGALDLSFSENVRLRFESAGWRVIEAGDANNIDALESAIKDARTLSGKPTLVIVDSIIGYGSKNQNTEKVHGAPLGEEDALQLRSKFQWPYEPFVIPNDVYEHYHSTFYQRGIKAYRQWKRQVNQYRIKHEEDYIKLNNLLINDFSVVSYPTFPLGYKEATRSTSNRVIQNIASVSPLVIGGAADVAKSVNTTIKNASDISSLDASGQNINYGIREFAMSCIQTGLLLHGGLRSFIGSFLIFSDYMKASIRTAALMKTPSIYVFTHDSVAVGEDGPTHQPIEQLTTLRTIPNTVTLRPADANETVHAWRYAIENTAGPVFLALSRQNLTVQHESNYQSFLQGGYVAAQEQSPNFLSLVCSGSEVELGFEIRNILNEKYQISSRVISMPSTNLFDRLGTRAKRNILGNRRDRIVAIEMGTPDLWYKYADYVYGLSRFGESGKGPDVAKYLGFEASHIAQQIALKFRRLTPKK